MVRGLAREFVHDGLARRYELDRSQEDELAEMIGRRLMEAVHEVDSPETQAIAERVLGNCFRMILDSEQRHRQFVSPEVGQALARDVVPFLPNLRELVRKVGQDVRPMLPMKQQLRLAADLMAVKTALDGFEATMQRWEKGDVDPGEDPFDPDEDLVQTGPDGESEQLKKARQSSVRQDQLENLKSQWQKYADQAAAFYGFDEAQKSTARSIVREAVTRADTILNGPAFQEKDVGMRMWWRLWNSLGSEFRGDHPVRHLLIQQFFGLQKPLVSLGDEFKERIDRIARQDQQRAAEQRIAARLAELGVPPAEAADGLSAGR
jgi:hypothetical protein